MLRQERNNIFESTYPIVMTHNDSLSVDITAPDAGGSGIGSAVNFIVNGDTDVLISKPYKVKQFISIIL